MSRAEHDVAILAERDVNLLAANDVTNYKAVHEQMFAGVTATVSSGLISAAQSIGDAADQAAKGSNSYSAAHAAFAGFQAYQVIKNAANSENPNQGLGGISLTAGFNYAKNETSSTVSTPVVTTIRGGNSVTIEAKSGSITGHGAQILAGYDMFGNEIPSLDPTAGDITLSAGKDVTLTSAQSITAVSGNSIGASAGVGVAAAFGTGGFGQFGPTVSASGSKGTTGETIVTTTTSTSPARVRSP